MQECERVDLCRIKSRRVQTR